MTKTLIAIYAGIGLTVLGVLFIIGIFMWGLGVLNREAVLNNQVLAKVQANKSEHDTMSKTIKQSAQITQAEADAVAAIIVGNSQARGKSGGTMVSMVKEAVPSLDPNSLSFKQLMNVVISKRETFNRVQKELVDVNLQHDNMFDVQPSGMVVSIFGRKKQDISMWIITSAETQEAYKTGQDNDTDLGLTHKPSAPVEK
jgi:anti-sigma factor RsiW